MQTNQIDIKALLPVYALPGAIAVIVMLFTAFDPVFVTPSNLLAIIHQISITGIMAVCMTFVIMTGGIDLSVGTVLAMSGLISYFMLLAGFPLPLAITVGILAGACTGCFTGYLVAYIGLPAMIVSLGSLSIIRGSALLAGGPDLHQIQNQPGFEFIGNGFIAGVPLSVWLFVLVTAILVFVQRKTVFGLLVSNVGDNERAAFLSGRATRRIKMATYAICGMGAALAGIIQASQVHTASATFGEFGTELDVIAAVVLGGTSMMGGKGSILRTVMGVLFLGVLNNGFNILDVPIEAQLMVKGAIIVVSLSLTEWANAKAV
ncbi:ABC transporter permease [Polycladidibacter hongkongensis]|uniref:ABC transporter permease n=1 Tax=Polycladidibacter hongkongensis TaxID=1647556 RepID=UPI0008321022|nr:ABC transporter permease [Pseudovibrio hongkongensis]